MSASRAPALLADRRASLPDVQASAPQHAIALSAVGVTAMRMPIVLDRGPAIATLRMSVDLVQTQRGAHMSRFRRAVDGVAEGLDPFAFARGLAAEALRLHSYASSVSVVVETEALAGDLVLPVVAQAIAGATPAHAATDGSSLTLTVMGSTVCPCSFAMSGNRYAHAQRAEVQVEVVEPTASIAELQSLCSQAFSAPVAMVLDRPAEKAMVDRMFAHPRFVEDVAREVVHQLRSMRAGKAAKVVATAFESIHPYNCFAAWEGSLS